MAKKEKAEKTESKARGRTPVWGEGTTPNKADMKKLVKGFTESEGRKTKASLARYAVENDLSVEALVAMAPDALEGKELTEKAAAALRRSALRDINGGAKVKRKPAGEKAEKPAKEKPAKAKAEKGSKAKSKKSKSKE